MIYRFDIGLDTVLVKFYWDEQHRSGKVGDQKSSFKDMPELIRGAESLFLRPFHAGMQ